MSRSSVASREDNAPPIALSEGRSVSLPIVFLCTLLATTAAGAIAYNRLTTSSEDHEKRITQVEKKTEDIAVMKNDLRWVREFLEEERALRMRGSAAAHPTRPENN